MSPDGWIASQDGIVLSKYRTTFREFTEDFSSIIEDLKDKWPRQNGTPKLGSYTLSNAFKAEWLLSLPENWILLPDGRVVINKNTIWYPNGIVEYLDFKQEKYSFEEFYRFIFSE